MVLFVIYTAHQFSVVVLPPHHAVVDDDREENDGHPHSIAKQLKLTLSQQTVVAIEATKDYMYNTGEEKKATMTYDYHGANLCSYCHQLL